MKEGDALTWNQDGRSLFEEVKAERKKRKALGLLNPSSESEQEEEEDKRVDANLLNVKKVFDSETFNVKERQPRPRSSSAKAKNRKMANGNEILIQPEKQNIKIGIRSLKTAKF